MDDDLVRPGVAEVVQCRVDLLGDAVSALDPGRPLEAARQLGLGFVRHALYRNDLAHAPQATRRQHAQCGRTACPGGPGVRDSRLDQACGRKGQRCLYGTL